MSQALDQQRAAAAWKQTEAVNDEYKQLIRGTSAHILTNGLGQTLAFYLAKANGKKDKPHYRVIEHVAQWVLGTNGEADASKAPQDLLDVITSGTSDEYRRLTTEALAYLDWLKRFAEARAEESKQTEKEAS